MGIRKQFLEVFESAASEVAARDSVWVMGTQDCRFRPSEANRWLETKWYPKLPEDWREDPEPLFKAIGFKEYVDVDVNERARRKFDLAQPLPADCVEVADMVIDSGTLEHIFDVRAAIENMNRIVKPGGVILHLSPVNFFAHGFVNFNPSFFDSFYGTNGYSKLFTTYQITVHNPLRVPRITPWLPAILARFNLPYAENRKRDWNRFMTRWSVLAKIPKNLVYVGAYKKPDGHTEFKSPTDVWE